MNSRNEALKNSPLHGLSDEKVLAELVEFYGWPVLDAAVDLKCLRIKPTLASALVFLKKHEWARNRLEDFYLYTYKGMPEPSEAELELKPRERGFASAVSPREPKKLTAKEAERGRRKDVPKAGSYAEPEAEFAGSSFRSVFSKPRK